MVYVMAEYCASCTKDPRLAYISFNFNVRDKDTQSQMLTAHPTIYDSQHGQERLMVLDVFLRKG